jgi:hypothetical protein
MSDDFNWQKMKAKFKDSVKIEKELHNTSIDITFLDDKLIEDDMIIMIIKNKRGLENSLKHYIDIDRSIKYDIEIVKNQNKIIITFEEEEIVDKAYNFFKDFFHGDLLKDMVEALFGAFGRFYGEDNQYNNELNR